MHAQSPLGEAFFNRGVKNVPDLRIGGGKIPSVDAGPAPEVLSDTSSASPRFSTIVMKRSITADIVIITSDVDIPIPILAFHFLNVYNYGIGCGVTNTITWSQKWFGIGRLKCKQS